MRYATVWAALLLSSLPLASCGNPEGSEEEGQPPVVGEEETNGNDGDHADSHNGQADDTAGDPGATEPGSEEERLYIPPEWVSRTAQEWPDSLGFAEHAPVQEFSDECLLFDDVPEFFDEVTHVRFSGFGSYGRPTTNFGNEPPTEDSYRYLCSLARADEQQAEEGPAWTPSTQLMVTDSVEHAEQTVEAFLDQPDLPERLNDVQTVMVHGTEVHTVEREFPTNPGNGGELEAIFYDETVGAIIKLRLHSMDEDLRAEHGSQGIAEDLARLLLEAQ